MEKFEEIKYPKKETDKIEGTCARCFGNLYFQLIPCPDNIPGCCAIHYGYRCDNCGRVYKKVKT